MMTAITSELSKGGKKKKQLLFLGVFLGQCCKGGGRECIADSKAQMTAKRDCAWRETRQHGSRI